MSSTEFNVVQWSSMEFNGVQWSSMEFRKIYNYIYFIKNNFKLAITYKKTNRITYKMID